MLTFYVKIQIIFWEQLSCLKQVYEEAGGRGGNVTEGAGGGGQPTALTTRAYKRNLWAVSPSVVVADTKQVEKIHKTVGY